METETLRPPPSSATTATLLRLNAIAMRCLLVTLFWAGGVGGLAFLNYTERVSAGHLQADEDSVGKARRVAIYCFPLLLCMIAVVELQILAVVRRRWSWGTCQIVFPVLLGATGALISWALFLDPGVLPSDQADVAETALEAGPKTTMLLAGGALIAYMSAAILLALRQPPPGAVWGNDFPAPWYMVLVLLGATFFGALHGWSQDSPQLQTLLEYRAERWTEPSPPGPMSDAVEVFPNS